jgi:hypothetical protein
MACALRKSIEVPFPGSGTLKHRVDCIHEQVPYSAVSTNPHEIHKKVIDTQSN